ncbi:hypothetical protein ASD24_24570 [Paenibacillus sp. Root52]|uniref:GNAT family N-acetyltransferase n=1 Tax=Paenibacillus sp. Root52 TaxID=1736552 RepID=UPI0006FB8E60|nr:GNAT family N-acetyltransferase [Paenibacillus sp. Root52]KQY90974.1 hypothetical protein ASD24_24570 [Paenibacillus sp. Root52]
MSREQVQLFYDKLALNLKAHSVSLTEYTLEDGCTLDFWYNSRKDELVIELLYVPEELRLQGKATKLLKVICTIADNIAINLTVLVSNVYGISFDILKSFYQSHGFQGDGSVMTRKHQNRDLEVF